ncbi:NUDIX hydrolase [Saccharopolyspora sp. ASAGF58]|uniref:NUDIX domain-containing protein n=1 Tax=Saccharopolyspora sp. ASAGF58 TaxID=2719023 RepID=UPI00143FC320|nr:NUDIX hydrolase [Saccharopolyspora sp. ASAGF58]QIZ34778.1 NUDIX hydrolase [Saccharopolyspora sp. ASAGF58]
MSRTPPAHPGTARGLIRDHDGRWLIVRPVNDLRWHLPGGLIEQNEPPTAACRREVREELGLDLTPGPLYAVGWNAPRRAGSRARYTFIFNMGTHSEDELAQQIRLQQSEIEDWQWSRPDYAAILLHPDMAERLNHARATYPSGYHETAAIRLPKPTTGTSHL